MKTPLHPSPSGHSVPTSMGDDQRVYVPAPSWNRYYGYVADAYWALDEARKRKQRWYDRRDEWVADVRQNQMPNADREDLLASWGSTNESKDLAGFEQWAQRQVMRLLDAGIEEPR
jgi:hypothetical protein